MVYLNSQYTASGTALRPSRSCRGSNRNTCRASAPFGHVVEFPLTKPCPPQQRPMFLPEPVVRNGDQHRSLNESLYLTNLKLDHDHQVLDETQTELPVVRLVLVLSTCSCCHVVCVYGNKVKTINIEENGELNTCVAPPHLDLEWRGVPCTAWTGRTRGSECLVRSRAIPASTTGGHRGRPRHFPTDIRRPLSSLALAPGRRQPGLTRSCSNSLSRAC